MSLERPDALWLLASILPYAALSLRVLWKIKALGNNYSSSEKARWAAFVSRRRWAAACGAAFLACSVLVLVNPSLGTRYVSERVRDVETAFVLDASNSMASIDGKDTRLGAAVSFIRSVVAASPGTRNALYAFKGSPVLLVPPTSSALAFEDALSWASPAVVTSAGSDVALALAAANRKGGAGLARTCILLTDGNDTGEKAAEACRDLVKSGVRLCIVGFGSSRPAAVLSPDRREVLDLDGRPVTLAGNQAAMREWAKSSGAAFVNASDAGSLSFVIDFVMKNSLLMGRARNTAVPAGMRDVFMAFSAFFFLLAAALSRPFGAAGGPGGRRSAKAKSAIAAVFVVTTLFSCSKLGSDFSALRANSLYSDARYNEAIALYLEGDGNGGSETLSYNVANAFVALGEFDSALPLYKKIIESGNGSLASDAWHNMGLVLYKRELYEDAREAFAQSLMLEPSSPDACRAYELALLALKQRKLETARERARATDGPGSESAMFSLSRKAHTELFVPGNSGERSLRNDH